eukprot:775211_1
MLVDPRDTEEIKYPTKSLPRDHYAINPHAGAMQYNPHAARAMYWQYNPHAGTMQYNPIGQMPPQPLPLPLRKKNKKKINNKKLKQIQKKYPSIKQKNNKQNELNILNINYN